MQKTCLRTAVWAGGRVRVPAGPARLLRARRLRSRDQQVHGQERSQDCSHPDCLPTGEAPPRSGRGAAVQRGWPAGRALDGAGPLRSVCRVRGPKFNSPVLRQAGKKATFTVTEGQLTDL
jgi:hypothetical protein